MRLVVVLMLLTVAPATAQVEVPENNAPELLLETHRLGNFLYWENGDEVVRAELWRYSETDVGMTWTKLTEVTGDGWAGYFDDQNLHPDTTWYGLIVQNEDGTFGLSNLVTAGKYPHCDWLYLNVPPTLRPECTLPPPWPYSFVIGTAEEILPL